MPKWWEDLYDCMDPEFYDADFDYSDNGWTNWALWNYYALSGELIDPCAGDGGQAIPLAVGCNMISITVDICWYVGDQPPDVIATNFVDVGSWGGFFTADKFASCTTDNLVQVAVWHYDNFLGQNVYKYYVNGGPSNLDYIAPGDAIWLWMENSDVLLLEGTRVRFDDYDDPMSYPAFSLQTGWNAVGVLAMNTFYFNPAKDGSGIEGPSDLQYATQYSSRAEMLQAAFGIAPSDWAQVDTIQVWREHKFYAYAKNVPDWANTLDFVLTADAAWIKVLSPITLNPVQPAGPLPTPPPAP